MVKTKEDLRSDLDLFCSGLWDYWVGSDAPELMRGVDSAPPTFYLYPYILEGGGTILFAPPGRGKALDDDIPIFTTQGWKRHGELKIGDYVFGSDGTPKKVLGTKRNEPNRPALLVTFDDGGQIIADQAHEWIIDSEKEYYRYRSRRIKSNNPNVGRPRTIFRNFRHIREPEIRETRDLLVKQRRAPAISISQPIRLPYRLLPIDPYILGCWLGDGNRQSGYITSGNEDIEHFRQLGIATQPRLNYWRTRVPGLRKNLRLLGILREKRIPEIYFLASLVQRLSLLQGIMDTDGYIDKDGRCELVTISPLLAQDYLKLIGSLGIKCSCLKSEAKLYGRVVSDRYRLNLYPPEHIDLFTLERKRNRQKPRIGKMTHYHYIKSVEPTVSKPMQCIEVEGGEYLVGERFIKTHNSQAVLLWAQSINAGVTLFWQVKKAPVLYINLERSAQSLQRRLAATNQVLGLPKDYPLLTFNRRGQPLSALAPAVARAVKQYGVKLIILDSISRAGYGDLTENRPVNLIIDTLSNLCDSWVAIGHTPRGDESHIFGAIMFDAGADIVVQLTSEPEANKLGVRFDIVKKNDLPDIPAQTWSFEFEEWSLSAVQKAGVFEFSELETKRKPKMLPSVIDFILNQDSAEATATEIADELGFNRVNVSNLLNKSGKFVKTRKIKQSQFYGVKDV